MQSKQNATALSRALWLHKEQNRFLGWDRMSLLEKINEMGSITKAAKAVGISYKTAWEQINLINNLAEKPLVERLTGGKGGGGTTLTVEGKKVLKDFQIIQEEHNKFLNNLSGRLGSTDYLQEFINSISMKVSTRNAFTGIISTITRGTVNAEVLLTLKDGTQIAATVSNSAFDSMGLEIGKEAYAIVKASSIIIGTDLHNTKTSARNIMCGTVCKMIDGPVNTEVEIDTGAGITISSLITHGSNIHLGLAVGGHACAIFKACSVILGIR